MTREIIRHPGPPAPTAWTMAQGTARRVTVTLPKGAILMQAVAKAMEHADCDSGVLVVDGLKMGPYSYVGPGPSTDGVHAAWYSATSSGAQAQITHGTAIVGRRDGAWWLHCHAVWQDGAESICGHLLPDQVTLSEGASVILHAFDGGAFVVSMNEETQFPTFHPIGEAQSGNAVIAKLNPHHDTVHSVQEIAAAAGMTSARVLGIGSLIGAQFSEGAPMASPISEVLVLPGAATGQGTHLPMHCVDPNGGQFHGALVAGGAPVCVTFELMLIAE